MVQCSDCVAIFRAARLVTANWWKVEGIWGSLSFSYTEHQGLPPSKLLSSEYSPSTWRHLESFITTLGIASCQENDLGSQWNEPLSSILADVPATLLTGFLTFPFSVNSQNPSLKPQVGFGLSSSSPVFGRSIAFSLLWVLDYSAGAACSAYLSCHSLPTSPAQQCNLLPAAPMVLGVHSLAP